jgi:hypothetical protein
MLEVIESEIITVKNIITESKHINKAQSRVSFIETPPLSSSCSSRNTKLEPSLDTVEEISEIPVIQETTDDNTIITIMDDIVNNIVNTQDLEPEIQTVSDVTGKLEEANKSKHKIVKFYKKIKSKIISFVKNI